MKLIKLIILFLAGTLTIYEASGQANAYINVLTQNGGIVNTGGTVFIEVTVGNSGPVDDIQAGKIRAQISVPGSITGIPVTGHVLPTGWTILSNSGTSIQICNSSDLIPVFEERTILIKVQGNNIGGPSTIIGQLDFRNNCASPGSLSGDDPSDNSSTTTIRVIPSCPLTANASAGTIACNGGTTTLTATVTNASGAIEYSLNGGPFQTSNTFTINAAGSPYVVTAREVSTPTCVTIATAVTVTDPPLVTAPVVAAITQPNCTTATGSVNLSGLPSGNWIINPGAISGNTATTTIGGLLAGIYNFTVTNAAGCTSIASANISISTQPATPTAPITGAITQPTCAISTGSVVMSGLPSGNWTVNPGNISGNTTSATITGLASGTYNFTVTNGAGCTSTGSASVVINSVPGAPAAPAYSVIDPTCTVATGTITITSDTTGVKFSLDNGVYQSYPASGYVVSAGIHTLTAQDASSCTSPVNNIVVNTQPVIPAVPAVSVVHPTCSVATGTVTVTSDTAGLMFSLDGGAYSTYPTAGYMIPAGVHTLQAKSAGGCISAVTNITVNAQPVAPTVTTSAGTIACFGGTTTLTVTGSGGTAPFQYSLNGGPFQSGNIFTISAGTYTATVRDVNLCTASAAITLTQPTALSATASSAAGAIGCNGGTTTLIVSATGGTGVLQYSLNGGPFQSGNNFTVSAGSYTVTVKDANNCTATTAAVTITQPAILTASSTARRITQCGGSTLVTVTASGGRTPYTSGIGTFTRGPGTWTFSVIDANGCSSTTSITIEAPGCMNLKVYPNPAKNSITINHSIALPGSTMQLFEINGALVMSKSIPQDAFQTTIDVSRLAGGTYIIVYWNGSDKKQLLFEKITSY